MRSICRRSSSYPAYFFFDRGLSHLRVAFTSEKLGTIVYPYFIWSVINIMIMLPLSGSTNNTYHFYDILLILFRPLGMFWFLYTLFVLSIAISILLRMGMTPLAVLAVAILVYPGILPISSYPWGILGRSGI